MIQKRLKKAMFGALNLKVGQKTAKPSIANPMKKGIMLMPCLMMLGPACSIVREKTEREGECSMYFVIVTQHRAQPRPTNKSRDPRGMNPLKMDITAPIIWKRLAITITIDQ
jgi:hypothetical protein